MYNIIDRNFINENEPIINFTEKCNIKKALIILQLSNQEIKQIFWTPEEINKGDNQRWSWSVYILSIKKYLQTIINNKGIIENKYRYGKNNYDGRLYVNGFGMQSLQHRIRNYLCNEYYNELDIKNCYYSLLCCLCEELNIECGIIKDYVLNRDELLKKYNLTKLMMLMALNKDKNKDKRDNDYYNSFISHLKFIKIQIKEKIKKLPLTENVDNPLSSSINKLLSYHEGLIIQMVVKKIGVENVGFPLFDGIYYDKNIIIDIEEYNREISHNYKYVKLSIKPTEIENFELPETMNYDNHDYDYVKEHFEKTHFQTLYPHCFWKQVTNSNGITKFVQYSISDFKVACEQYKILKITQLGIPILVSIYDKWIGDINRRYYDTIEFLPFGFIDNTSKQTYNSFDGFDINNNVNIDENMTQETNIDNFLEYISTLVGEHNLYKSKKDNPDVYMKKTEYMLKYLAHIMQFPEKRSEKIIVLKGWTGTGKDTLAKLLTKILGRKYCGITENPMDLFTDFNDILDKKICLFLNEVEGADAYKVQEKIKGLCTKEINIVNAKNEKKIEQLNCLRIFVFSNALSPVNIQLHDRRFIVFNTGYELIIKQNNKEQSDYASKFWIKFNDDMKNLYWLELIYRQLMEIDLTDFCPDKSSPVTDEYKILKSKNNVPLYDFIIEIFENKKFDNFYINKNNYYITFKNLKQKYIEYLQENDIIPEFKIKDGWIKSSLDICNNTFKASVRKQFRIGKNKPIRKEFCELKLKEMVEFIKQFIKDKDEDDKEIVKIKEL
jgi:hypothetical protein